MTEINIIIPTYNEENNIVRLLKAINKSLTNVKITIVDDSKINKIESILKKKRISKNIKYIAEIWCLISVHTIRFKIATHINE